MGLLHVAIGVAVVLFWRGITFFADKYFLPDNPDLSNLICVLIGVILLSQIHSLHDLY